MSQKLTNVKAQKRDPKSGRFVPEMQQWYQREGAKLCFWDLEVSDLKANNLGYIINWAVCGLDDTKARTGIITAKEVANRTFDKRITGELMEVLMEYDVWIGYYSSYLDLPYTRTRAIKWGYKFPGYGQKYHFDLWYLVRSKLQLSRNSLAVATEFLGIPGKTPLDFTEWKLGALGDPKALKSLDYHCQKDVLILRDLFKKLEKYKKFSKTSI